jgi:hypothetical protein
MTALGWLLAVALAVAAGRLVLWTTLRRWSARASTLEAVRGPTGDVEYSVAPLGLGCRGHVVVRHERALELGLLQRLRGLEPLQVVELLRAEGLRAELMPGVSPGGVAGSASGLAMAGRSRSRTAD